MALWVCVGCSTAYSVGAPACPHCGSTDSYEEGSLPKISVHGGATNAADDPAPTPAVAAAVPVPAAAEDAPTEAAEETTAETPEPAPRKRTARKP